MIKTYQQIDCPIASTAKIIGDLWTILIIRELIKEPKRFNQLQLSVSDSDLKSKISTKTLTQRLKFLEQERIIEKKDISNHSEYCLTSKGNELISIVQMIKIFGEKHLSTIN